MNESSCLAGTDVVVVEDDTRQDRGTHWIDRLVAAMNARPVVLFVDEEIQHSWRKRFRGRGVGLRTAEFGLRLAGRQSPSSAAARIFASQQARAIWNMRERRLQERAGDRSSESRIDDKRTTA